MPIFGPLNCDFVLSKLMDDLVMWFSSGGTKSVWHFDDYENLNCLIKGSLHSWFVRIFQFITRSL